MRQIDGVFEPVDHHLAKLECLGSAPRTSLIPCVHVGDTLAAAIGIRGNIALSINPMSSFGSGFL